SLEAFPALPTNYVTTNSNQTELTGTKTWGALHNFTKGTKVGFGAPSYTLTSGNTSGTATSDITDATLPSAFAARSINYDFPGDGSFPIVSATGLAGLVETKRVWTTGPSYQMLYPQSGELIPLLRASDRFGTTWGDWQHMATREW